MEQIQYIHFKTIKLTKKYLKQLQIIHQECFPHTHYTKKTYLSFCINEIYKAHAIIDETHEIQSFIILMINAEEADIVSIGTKLNKRRTGIASNLLLSCEKIYNLKKIFLEVSCHNIVAINFYKSQGFDVINIRKAYTKTENNKIIDAYLMSKKCSTWNISDF